MAIKVNCVKLVSLGTNHTTQEQFEKIKEEFKEVEVAYRNYKHTYEDIEHLKSELYDLMQASYHMLELLEVTDADNDKHLKKIDPSASVILSTGYLSEKIESLLALK